ncbi:hypothetical protein ACVWYN_003268 [Pedobacter sp. UYP24]
MKRKSTIYVTLLSMFTYLMFMVGCKKKDTSLTPDLLDNIIPALNIKSALPANYNYYFLQNMVSGLALEVNVAALLTDRALLQQYKYSGTGIATSPNQKWILVQINTEVASISDTTTFRILNVGSGKYLESPNNTSGSQLWQNKLTNSKNQLWYLKKNPINGSYEIANTGNNMAVTNHNNSLINAGIVTQETYTGTTNQFWALAGVAAEGHRDDEVVNFFHRPKITGTTVAFDQGNSVPLTYGNNNGKVLWITQDAYDANQLQSNGAFNCGAIFNYHNSAFLQPASRSWDPALSPNITNTSSNGKPLQLVPSPGLSDNNSYSWTGTAVEIGNQIIMDTGEGNNGVTPNTSNQALYSITENDNGLNWGNALRITPNGMTGQTTYTYHIGLVKKPTNDTVYAYGSYNTYFNSQNLLIARFAASAPAVWTYWTGTGWGSLPSIAAAALIHIGTGTTTQQNASVAYVNGKYVLMQMDEGFFCDPTKHNIYLSTSNSPTGPFTAPVLVYSIPDTYQGHIAKYYTGIIHPEFNNGHNELLLTYSLNYNGQGGTCTINTCTSIDASGTTGLDPNFYQVKGVRIPYSLIGL